MGESPEEQPVILEELEPGEEADLVQEEEQGLELMGLELRAEHQVGD
jgi:hypothetical protein